jgi:hypothetical protein
MPFAELGVLRKQNTKKFNPKICDIVKSVMKKLICKKNILHKAKHT